MPFLNDRNIPGENVDIPSLPTYSDTGTESGLDVALREEEPQQLTQARDILRREGFWEAFNGKAMFSSVFGSLAYQGSTTNDIDIFTLLRKPLTEVERADAAHAYFVLHRELGLHPDLDFPGEYVALEQARRSLIGGGFLMKAGLVEIPEIPNGSAWTSFNDFRHHLTALGGPSRLLFGSPEAWSRLRIRALSTLVVVVLLKTNAGEFSRQDIVEHLIGTGKSYLGFADHPGARKYLTQELPQVLARGVERGWWIETRSPGSYIVAPGQAVERLAHQIARFNERFREP